MNMKFDLIMPIAESHVDIALITVQYVMKYLKPEKIIIITKKAVVDRFENTDQLQFIDEDSLIPGLSFSSVSNLIKERNSDVRRTGWYFQQLLKMAYAEVCQVQYYLVWDADTLPIRNISFFNAEGKVLFNIKKEYHKPYFKTIHNLLGIKKQIKGSFISEHMMFDKNIMLNILESIEKNNKYSGMWFEKIIASIESEYLSLQGFSEYETYGTYLHAKYRQVFQQRNFPTLRCGSWIFDSVPKQEVIQWMGKYYYTMSMETWQHKVIINTWYDSATFRKLFSATIYMKIVLVWGYTREGIIWCLKKVTPKLHDKLRGK